VIPIVAIVGLKRHLFGRSADPERDGRPDRLRVLTSLAAGVGTLVVLIWPFGLSIWAPAQPTHGLIDRFISAANLYKGLTINAFNLWRNAWSGMGDTITWGCDAPSLPPPETQSCVGGAGVAFTLGSMPVSWQLVGAVLFGVAALIAYWQIARRDDAEGLLFGALVLAVAFFALPTRVHERYVYYCVPLATVLAVQEPRWWIAWAVMSVVATAEMLSHLWVGPSPGSFAVSGLLAAAAVCMLPWALAAIAARPTEHVES